MSSTSQPAATPRPAPGPAKARLPIGRWILVASGLFALYAWTFGPYGVVRQARTAAHLRALEARNDSLQHRLRILEDSLRLLSNDSSTIAGEARRLGLVLPGEISVRFVDTTRHP